MLKRIAAWILLIGFVGLIINIVVIGYQRSLSFTIYLAVAALFIIVMNRTKKRK